MGAKALINVFGCPLLLYEEVEASSILRVDDLPVTSNVLAEDFDIAFAFVKTTTVTHMSHLLSVQWLSNRVAGSSSTPLSKEKGAQTGAATGYT